MCSEVELWLLTRCHWWIGINQTSQIQHNEQIICGHCTYYNIILLILINLGQAGLSLSFARSFGMYFVNWQINGTVKCFFSACFEWMCGIDLAQRLIVILIWDDMSDRPYSTATLETTTFRDSDLETVLITILTNIYHWIWTQQWLHFKLWMLRWQQRQCHWDQIKFLSLTQLLFSWLIIHSEFSCAQLSQAVSQNSKEAFKWSPVTWLPDCLA